MERSDPHIIMPNPPQVSPPETEIIIELAKRQLPVPGDCVELGCYRGDTSLVLRRLLRDATPSRPNISPHRLWLYDSFAGLPAKSSEDSSVAGDAFTAGALNVTKREVVERFKKANLPVPTIKKAFFEELSPTDLPEQISFAFLDGDLYQSIKTSLSLVTPRLHPQGLIIVHDYNNPELPGVSRALDEFLATHPGHFKLQLRHTLAILTPS